MSYYFFSPNKNETRYHIPNHRFNLANIAQLIKVASSIKHESAETNLWKCGIPRKTQARLLKATTNALYGGLTD